MMRKPTATDSDFGADQPDGFTAVDELLLTMPEPYLAPDRFAAIHAALVHELVRGGAKAHTSRKIRGNIPDGLRRARATRWRTVLSGAALGVLAVALALEHNTIGGTSVPPGTPHPSAAAASPLDAILTASSTAPFTALTGTAATKAQASCVAVYNANPIDMPQVSYSTYDHITDSTIMMAGRQGQVIVIALRAGPDIVSCLEVSGAHGSTSWTAYPSFALSPGYVDGKVVPPDIVPLSTSTPVQTLYTFSITGPARGGGGGEPAIDVFFGRVTPQVAKVAIEITDPKTHATQEVSQAPDAGLCFFWWPWREGSWTKITAYAANGTVLGSLQQSQSQPTIGLLLK